MAGVKNPAIRAGRPSAAKKAATLNELARGEKDSVRLNFELPRADHIKIKVHAARAGKSIADVLREFVAQLRD